MTSQGVPTRKRPAPGTSPIVHAPIGSMPSYTDTTNQLSDDQFLQWGQDPHAAAAVAQPFPIDTTPYTTMSYAAANQDGPVPTTQPSNQLTRRSMNQLMNRNRSFEQSSVSSVPDSGGDGWGESVAELEERALIAKRDAQAKRKQIPPFVQKLRSFLDEPQYADFIRWSDDGNSFIVLDEGEFARRLIPELFKHNKYASFVRQLNMYGFHKKVGLSDNSMRASERKNKSPSEYANPYFKRGHPDLLWLIQKPKNAPGQGSKGAKGAKMKTEDGEEHDDDLVDDIGRDERPRFSGQLAITNGQDVMPKDQLAGVYHELQTIRQQQQIISSTISKLRREHEQLYAQAANFQEQHSRHENSINAILTFLATVYNRSLQGHDGPQNIANSFSGIISQDQGNVVDVGDGFALSTLGNDLASGTPRFKKQPLLLKAPPQVSTTTNDRATTLSPAASNYDTLSNRKYSRQSSMPSHTIEEVQDVTSPPTTVPSRPSQDQRKPQRDIMSMIQLSNAANGIPTTFADFPNIVNSLETSGGNSALTPKQRADMLRQIARDTTVSDPSIASSNNALIAPTPPPMPVDYSAQLANTRNEIDNLMKMQAEQDRSVQNLTNLLQPLSPTGQIPGLQDGHVPPPSLDLDQIFNSHDYFTDYNDLENKGNFDLGDTAGNITTGVPSQAYRATADDRTTNDDLFNFDNLGNEAVDTDLFGDTARASGTGPGYFDNYEDYIKPGFHNDDIGNRNTGATVAGNGTNKKSATSPETGRIIETLTDSEATSPANTVDENYQGPNTSNTVDVSIQSPKRRRRA